jgi:hypothetical protein
MDNMILYPLKSFRLESWDEILLRGRSITPQVLGLQSTLALHEFRRHSFICEHETQVTH